MKEFPQHENVTKQTDFVANQKLGSNCPVEEAKVTRMPENRVEAVSNELMRLLVLSCYDVIETRPSLCHGKTSHSLPYKHQYHSDSDGCGIDQSPTISRKNATDDEFHSSQSMRRVVRSPVIEQQKTLGSEGVCVISSGSVVFQEMENCQTGRKGRKTPPCRLQTDGGHGPGDACGGNEAEEECLESYPGEVA